VQSASISTPLLFANRSLASGICDEPVDQISRDPKLVAHRNHKCIRHFRSIGEGAHHRSRASASAQSSSEADCHWERMATQAQQSLAQKSSAKVYDLSATVYCI
jgi:hypothetical protein